MTSIGVRKLAVLAGLACSGIGAGAQADDTAPAPPPPGKDNGEQIVVTGIRRGEASALQEQRESVGVTSIMSSEEIERAPEGNIADIVTRLPGVSAYADNQLGQAATGENEYITIRGLDASYNGYAMNGVPLAETDPGTRAISLDMLAPYGIDSVKINKTPTADMDGASIGGIIDFRTPTAFDFAGPLTKVTAVGQLAELAAETDQPNLGATGEIELARRFGASNEFGIYASAYYSVKNTAAEATSPNVGYEPTFASALLPSGFAPANLSDVGPLSVGNFKFDFYTDHLVRYGGNTSLDLNGGDQTLHLRLSYGRYEVTGEDNQISITTGILPSGTPSINPFDPAHGYGLYNTAGLFAPNGVFRGGYFETRNTDQGLAATELGGTTRLGRLALDYNLFYSYGVEQEPNYLEASLYGAPILGTVQYDQNDPSHVLLIAPPPVRNYLFSLNSDALWKTQGNDASSQDNRFGGEFNAVFEIGASFIDTVRAEIRIDASDRSAYDHPFFHDDNNFIFNGPFFGGPPYSIFAPGGPTIAQIPGQIVNNLFNGSIAGPFKLLNPSYIISTTLPYKYVSDNSVGGAGAYNANDYNANTTSGSETIYAGYVMATAKIGDVEIVPGLRYEWTDFDATHWLSSGNNNNGDFLTGGFVSADHGYGEVLPGLNVNYRPDPLTVFRGSVRESFSRPAYSLLNGETTVSVNPLNGEILGISEPNPNLKQTESTNFDVSAEFYNSNAGIVSVSGFYKRIRNFIYDSESGTSPDITLGGNVPTNSVITNGTVLVTPQNGGAAKLYGTEIDIRQRLAAWLPQPFDGLALEGNATFQRSAAQSDRPDHFGRETWLPRAPELIYNIGLIYEKDGVRADLAYNYTGLQLLGLTSDDLDHYLQPSGTLDFTAEYGLWDGLTVGFALQNLLNTARFYETEGKTKQYLAYDPGGNGSYIETGRTYLLKASYQF